jgi:uncharacterized membrane protein YeaQ/YmgE (transglycosylase-associated protein family)
MGIIAWIVLGLGAGLLANMAIPGKRQQGLILTCLIGIAGALLGGWAATNIFHIHSLNGFFKRLYLAHRHRRGSRPPARLPPLHRPVVPQVRLVCAPLTDISTAHACAAREKKPHGIRAEKGHRLSPRGTDRLLQVPSNGGQRRGAEILD